MIIPDLKVVFVGDLVVKNQPPFLAFSNLEEWLVSLDLLLGEYKNYTVVSGRSGVVTSSVIQAQHDFLLTVQKKLDTLAQKQAALEALEGLVQPWLAGIKAPAERQKQFARRLAYGLRHYYARHYQPTSAAEINEE